MAAHERNRQMEIVAHLESLENCVLEVRMPTSGHGDMLVDPMAGPWNAPVCGQAPCVVPVYAWILSNNAGAAPCATAAQINAAIASATNIWSQCTPAIRFNLTGIGGINSTADQNPPAIADLTTICSSTPAATAHAVNVFFVCSMLPTFGTVCGAAWPPGGCCVFIATAPPPGPPGTFCCPDLGNVLAHEFGHVLGIPHVTTMADYCNLMYAGPRGRGCCSTLTAAQCSLSVSTCQAGGCW